jgi:hypothetical protein
MFSARRLGVPCLVPASMLLPTDEIFHPNLGWRSASSVSHPVMEMPAVSAPVAPSGSPGGLNFAAVLSTLAVAAGVSVVAYKAAQAAFDEDFGPGEFPRSFREELIAHHVARNGSWCGHCERRVPRRHLTVDHIVSMQNGGRSSRANAQVMCRSCNSRKGAKNTILHRLRGRG